MTASPQVLQAAASTRTEAEVRYERARRAADAILAPITMEIGRIMVEAPDMDMVPLMAEHGVVITGHMLNALYNATDKQ